MLVNVSDPSITSAWSINIKVSESILFRYYKNFDVDQYVRDVDTVDLINVYNESNDIHEEAANCISMLNRNANKHAHIKKKEAIDQTVAY